MDKKLILIDGNSLFFRAYFATAYSGNLMHNKAGLHTNALYGFSAMLMKILEEHQFTHLFVAFDTGKKTFRHDQFEHYKAGRKATPPELLEQFPYVFRILNAARVAHFSLSGYEADDLIGTYAKRAEAEGFEVQILTSDRDMLQLVSDQVTVRLTKKGLSELEDNTPAMLYEKYQLTASQIPDLKGLMGDTSDNIIGIPGVGEKTAVKLLGQYGTIEGIYEHIDELKGKQKERFVEYEDLAFKSRKLATIETNVPVEASVDDMKYDDVDAVALTEIFQELDFQSFIKKLNLRQSVLEQNGTDESMGGLLDGLEDSSEVLVVDKITADMLPDSCALDVEIPTSNYHHAEIEGFAVVNETVRFYVPFTIAKKSEEFLAWLADESKKKAMFDYKKAQVGLEWHGIALNGVSFDLMLAGYILDSTYTQDEIAPLAASKGYDVAFVENVYGKGAKFAIPETPVVAQYAIDVAHAVWYLKDDLESELKANGQYELYQDLEMPLAHVLGDMEYAGIHVNRKTLDDMSDDMEARIGKLEANIHELAGTDFNIGSPKQLGVILFEKLGLPVIKKTKTGYSTAADVLEQLRTAHPIIEDLLMYRQLTKLKSTYIDGLRNVIFDDGKIHTIYKQAQTSTGRISSIEPNLQNIPIRLEEGKLIRKAFEPSDKDRWIFAADYSQIELRVLAHIAKIPALIDAFKHGRDIHTETAVRVFEVAPEDVSSNMRRQAKAVNFGIIYGISDFGLSQQLGIPVAQAKQFIEKYFQSFPEIKAYMKETIGYAREHGYVKTLFDRKRYIPEIRSKNYNERSFGERAALNAPIQGSAADIIKFAMIEIERALEAEQLQSKLLLQVHDELIFDVVDSEKERIAELVSEKMEAAVTLDVPLKVDYAFGRTWYDAK